MFELHFSLKAKKYLQKSNQRKRLKVKLLILAINPRDLRLDVKKMKGLEGLLRLRVGDVRIVYQIDASNKVINIIDIDNRGDIY